MDKRYDKSLVETKGQLSVTKQKLHVVYILKGLKPQFIFFLWVSAHALNPRFSVWPAPVDMGFFDLNVPYSEASPSDKANRIKLATMAMELGYSGVAYNRTIKGVMSDRDRCSIPLPTLSSLLKLSPSLSSSVYFHRDLLGVPRASPFRQYTRLTVCADSPSQAQALNSGNPILKTYDLVSIRPLNQTVFDQACEKLEVLCFLLAFFLFFLAINFLGFGFLGNE